MKPQYRPLDREEMAKLSERIAELNLEEHRELNGLVIAGLGVSTLGSAFHIYHYDTSDWSLISKFLICLCPVVIWVMIAGKYQGRKTGLQP